jgi:hypothetical protein
MDDGMVIRITSADTVKYCIELATPLGGPSQISRGGIGTARFGIRIETVQLKEINVAIGQSESQPTFKFSDGRSLCAHHARPALAAPKYRHMGEAKALGLTLA